ncbi:RICIN domain-containing protein [Arthrobacter sp. B6]|uniref:RICIN domain-containing protein n=1 Tax=Arthrobacter sp. B6 TaxID=1570137 RepID=UPI001E488816|nr:RICIN domain-containing protein [Arthrobacter sp. B6]
MGSPTGHPTQVWSPTVSGGWWKLANVNSGKLLEIAGTSTTDGAAAQQYTANGFTCQEWKLTREGIQ